ncbi:MAG: hypothetical protein HOF94_23410 [Alphaproteobacteria bacterium]|nr:hypothetical protein [Alphaproteobacteria bacterium]
MQKIAAILRLECPSFDDPTIARLEFDETVHRNAGLVVGETDTVRTILFMRAKSAAVCAVELRRQDKTSLSGPDRTSVLRSAISLGPVLIGEATVDGDAIEIAENLATILEPGDIFVSGSCRNALADNLPVDYEQLREKASAGFRLVVDDNEVLSAIRHENPVAPDWNWKIPLPVFSMLILIVAGWFWFNMPDSQGPSTPNIQSENQGVTR